MHRTTEPSTTDDFTAGDTIEEIIMDEIGVDAVVAAKIAEWHRRRIQESEGGDRAVALRTVVSNLIWPGNIRIRALALAFALGLNRLTGFKSLRDAERKTGFSCSWISAEQNRWIDLLELPRGINSKSEGSRGNYSAVQSGEKHWRKQLCQTHPTISNSPS